MGYDPMAADNDGPFGDDLVRTDNYLRLAEESAMGVHDLSKIKVVHVTPEPVTSRGMWRPTPPLSGPSPRRRRGPSSC